MYPDRKKQRERSKKAKWEKQDKEGVIGRRNCFGNLDLTPYNIRFKDPKDIKLK